MIKSRNDIIDILEEYLITDYEMVYDFYSGGDDKWSSHKRLLYANGAVLGKFREKDISTMNALKLGVLDEALIDEI